jgi:hypothetical protein
MLNMHNSETGEYVVTQADDEKSLATMNALYDRLLAVTSFDPSPPQKLRTAERASGNTNWLYQAAPHPHDAHGATYRLRREAQPLARGQRSVGIWSCAPHGNGGGRSPGRRKVGQ